MEAQTALARQFDNENHERNKLLEQLYLGEKSCRVLTVI